MPEPGLLSPMFARGPVAEQVSQTAWLRALIDVEAAVARAGGDEKLAAAILAADIGLDELVEGTARTASPLAPIAALLRERAGDGAHRGVTSQDIVDTALMVVMGRALAAILQDARAAADAAARLARAHRDTPVMGRTLMQPAGPTTFGLRAARWMAAIDDAADWIESVRRRDLVVDMGGPHGHADPALSAAVAADLGLGDPTLSWHAVRLRTVRLGGAIAALGGALGKVARDVTILSQAEIAEVHEGDPTRGGSSSIANKRNATAAVMVLACADRLPGLVATLYATMDQELERGAGGWQAEWATLTELLALVGSAAAWACDLLSHLQVDAARMRAGAGPDPDIGAAVALVDRALAARA